MNRGFQLTAALFAALWLCASSACAGLDTAKKVRDDRSAQACDDKPSASGTCGPSGGTGYGYESGGPCIPGMQGSCNPSPSSTPKTAVTDTQKKP